MKFLQIAKKHVAFGLVFALAKGVVYFTPLLLADHLSKIDFGILEYALAGLGMLVNTVINLGVPASYPYFILKRKNTFLENAFSLHPVVLVIPFLVNQILFFLFGLNTSFYLAFNVSYIIANQLFYSTQLKSHERPIPAVLLDSGIYIVLLCSVLFLGFGNTHIDISLINFVVFFYALVYVFFAIHKLIKAEKKYIFKKYYKILKFGFHLLISTFIIFLITTSGRILVELFFDFELVGVYAFYFRLSAIVVMIHQIINITFFKKIYTLDPRVLDKYFNLFFIFIFILSICCFSIAPFVLKYFSEYFIQTFGSNKDVYFLLSAQMVMWIGTALNSNIINRENLAANNNLYLGGALVLAIILLFSVRSHLTLSLLTCIHFSLIFLTCVLQYISMYKKNIYFKKSLISLSFIYILSMGYYIVML